MARASLTVLATLALGGCTQILGIDALHGGTTDGGTTDAQADASGPSQSFKITGKIISTNSMSPNTQSLPGAAVELRTFTGAVLANAQSDANGVYTLTVSSTSGPVDGFVLVQHPQFIDSEMFLRGPTDQDLTSDIPMFSPQGMQQFASIAGTNVPDTASMLVMSVSDKGKALVAGAVVQVTPATPLEQVCYTSPFTNNVRCNDPAGLQTGADGLAIVFGVLVGAGVPMDRTVEASKPGITFLPRIVTFTHQTVAFVPLTEK